MPCVHVKIGNDPGTICFPHQLRIKSRGKWYNFEWAEYTGPVVTAIDHIPYKGILPETDSFWDGLDKWIAQGKCVGRNGEAIFDGLIKVHSDGKLRL